MNHRVNPAEVFLGLGANLGDPVAQLRRALQELQGRGVLLGPIRKSSLYRTPPWGPIADQPWFINAVVRGKTPLPPLELLAVLKAIEHDLGRSDDAPRWGPRTIDLDVLLYGSEVSVAPELIIPHPRLTRRAFVLVPLLEIAPEAADPATGTPYRVWLRDLRDDLGDMERLAEEL